MMSIVLSVLPSLLMLTTTSMLPGDREFAGMDYSQAVARYDSALQKNPSSPPILWRLARVTVCIADVAEENHKEELYRRAEQYARQCIAADSGLASGYTWLAASLGNIAMFEGGKTKVRMCTEIKAALDRAVSLDSLDDIAYSIMGSFYLALGNVSWFERQLAAVFLGSLPEGGYEEAEGAILHAIRLAPDVIRHRYERGLISLAQGRNAEARESFRKSRELPSFLASDDRTKLLAAEWIRKLDSED